MKAIGTLGFVLLMLAGALSYGQTSMINVYGRNSTLLNGKWETIIDPFDAGIGWRAIYKDAKPTGKNDFLEYSFDENNTLNVPGDYNSQMPELTYYESSVWYKKAFNYQPGKNERLFIHFGAANYIADVFLNGKKLGRHEGGFTPFQFEITGLVKEKDNAVVVRVNNSRVKNGIPGFGFDWFNYGGITRDVHLIKTHDVFIDDYKLQLDPADNSHITGYVKLNSAVAGKQVSVKLPELKIDVKVTTDGKGYAAISLKRKIRLWTPDQPRLYTARLSVDQDSISDRIGFRTIKVEGTQILLNGKPVFLRGVNIHEEIPQRKARAYSDADALVLINWAKELGCNFVRLVHYPHNEYTIKQAEEKGLMVWEEIPVYQGIDFPDSTVKNKAALMLREVIKRDKNRCNVIFWSVANETGPSKDRDRTLVELAKEAKMLDPDRLVTAAFNNVSYHDGKMELKDSVMKYVDVIGINEYMGWYTDWAKDPEKVQWLSDFNKPMIISEFGGESVYNNKIDTAVKASAWSEDYVVNIYNNQIKMFKGIPFLQGVCPWVLVDFRSPVRMQSTFQKGWNRKGLLSEQGDKKKAWFVMKEWYDQLKKTNGI
ncbi:glycoside hydrolase family 2 protein [Mucilaginibacter xinganensis]|uniref:Beta-glucuronidase n=1 Tax=Mucilaginibacter xinganensis TaxID=1234841 RepID=A0A223NUK1_9SPHI|nr:glycoside hydrolase family 2 TIM barrel-domain containing protein [Mucilaginibacter xinganensis]ASU33537.1 glycoside hydrolase family 2 [Mucilaginibacter xinganensis]